MKKNLIIVGVNGNLGTGVTKHLLKCEYHKYFLVDRHDIVIEEEDESKIIINVADLSKEKSVFDMFEQIKINEDEEYFLFSSVGGFDSSSIIDMNYDRWQQMFILNTNISFLLAKHFSKLVSKSSGGSICFTSAATAKEPGKNKGAYGASKAALNYLVSTLAIESKELGFTCNAISPYILDTADNRKWVEDESLLTRPEDVGILIEQLFNQYKLMNGNIIELKGKLL